MVETIKLATTQIERVLTNEPVAQISSSNRFSHNTCMIKAIREDCLILALSNRHPQPGSQPRTRTNRNQAHQKLRNVALQTLRASRYSRSISKIIINSRASNLVSSQTTLWAKMQWTRLTRRASSPCPSNQSSRRSSRSYLKVSPMTRLKVYKSINHKTESETDSRKCKISPILSSSWEPMSRVVQLTTVVKQTLKRIQVSSINLLSLT